MKDIVTEYTVGGIISAFVSGISFIGVALGSDSLPLWLRWLLVIAGIFSIGYLTYDNYQKSKVNAIICNTDDEIKQAMKGLINSSGTVCFMCRLKRSDICK